MNPDLFKFLVILFVIGIIFYLVTLPHREGLENQTTTTGIAGDSENYAIGLKNQSTKIKDTMLLANYRKNYEDSIINMEELLNWTMLKTMMNMQINPDNIEETVKSCASLNTLSQARDALNKLMVFIDKN